MNRIGTICMAVYRPDERLLKQQVDSIRSQSLASWVCVIGIDGQDPQALDLVMRYVDGDVRFDVRAFDENVGFYRNFERLMGCIDPRSDWVALADQDDFWYPEKLAVLVDRLDSSAFSKAAFGQARVVSESGEVLGSTKRRSTTPMDLLFENSFTGSFAVFKSSVLDFALPFPDPTDVAYHDHWIGLCALLGGSIEVVEAPLQDYVQHAQNVIGEKKAQPLLERWRAIGSRENGPHGRIHYLRVHRWGWRVAMASVAVARIPITSATDRQSLSAVASGRSSIRVAFLIIKSALLGRTPPARAGAHLVAMFSRAGDQA